MNNINFVDLEKNEELQAQEAIKEVLFLISQKNYRLKNLFQNTIITIGKNLIQSGGKANAEKMEIILDAQKNSMSLIEAEDFLVSQNILNKGDWSKALNKNSKPWSCLIYQLIHEFGHIVDGNAEGNRYYRVETKRSPTKYGSQNQSEAYAEAFAYWVFAIKLEKNLKTIVEAVVSKIEQPPI